MDLPSLVRETVDGVTAFASPLGGPVGAALTFRVGKVDETLATSGVTHAVEHLTLAPFSDVPYVIDGWVDNLFTTFYAEGSAEEVRGFLEAVCRTLEDLPVDGIDRERRVLLTEAEGRPASPYHALLAARYGARAHGVAHAHEFGLGWIDGEMTRAWARKCFTSGNAALWVTDPSALPRRLTLPRGERIAPPEARPVVRATPSYVKEPEAPVGLSLVGPTSPALSMATDVLQRWARRKLRDEEGLSYTVESMLDALDATTDHVALLADFKKKEGTPTLDSMLQLVRSIADGGVTDADIAREREARLRLLGDRTRHTGWMTVAVEDVLLGREPRTPEALAEELDRADPASVARAVADALPSTILLVSDEVRVPDDYVEAVPKEVDRLSSGDIFRPKGLAGIRNKLRISDEGIEWDLPGEQITVRFEECALAGRWESGGWALMGNNSAAVWIDPRDIAGGRKLIRRLEARFPEPVPLDPFLPPPWEDPGSRRS